ncbi:MAG: Crp/Fnr family transcriptional regulator [Candidatus Levybacteria bacterium]|nr:Crp/Fnr family transcriptional regulator [Candidatus Levybacteria bacterium]
MDTNVDKKIEIFFSKFRKQKYRKGEILVRAGDEPSGIFYLKTGRVKKYAISKKGDELIVNIFKPTSFFPMSHAMNHLPNNYFYEAMEDLELIKSPVDEVNHFVKNEPDVLYDLLSRVYRGSEGLLTRMTYLMAGNAYSRLIAELIIIAKRFGEKSGKTVSIKTTEKDLAIQVGMTRETVSREMKILKEKGLVKFNKGLLTIKDIFELEEELSSEI